MKKDENIFLALDGEMSSPKFEEGAALIQIGAYGAVTEKILDDFSEAKKFESPIRFSTGLWETSAESIHGISKEELLEAPTAEDVDDLFYGWLLSIGAKEGRRKVVPVGMNVGAFDMPFVNKFLPRSAELFTRRCVDVNGVCFSMHGMSYLGEELTAADWKQKSLEFGRLQWNKAFGDASNLAPHDALFDAWVQGFAWEFLKSGMRGKSLPMPEAYDGALLLQEKLAALLKVKSLSEVSSETGVPEAFVKGWSIGGRATRPEWIQSIDNLYNESVGL